MSVALDVESEDEAKKAVEDARKLLSDYNVKVVETITKVGNPIDELLKLIVKERIDMVVMGIKGRTDLEHVLVGSVADKLFRRSPVPVVSYRDEKNAQRLRKRIKLT